ncbi:30S ribosomal protein S12 methylthiotransferase RimO [Marivibrio halodurans]|uniref:Ribosomal protein uS12 methylthiotransferase RimO n=1 Tax=Marivibrio halodurans TaxID=2039722 RepID=A0A8J7RX32_9PROT|nr:30S ribosomal protein S12 methylthiotransferase RimO [Marivibrio halodurans]MBP5856015.1 30S ribosomal protein S12 methylthiotransferase RimO [Marivibrio halodurans]
MSGNETITAPSSGKRGARQPKVGMVSLGCPKALVDSERILTQLRTEGYSIAPDYDGADVVLVNTCGFLDSAKAESLEAIGEALAENGRVIVTGCMGADEAAIRAAHPSVLAVTGPHQYEQVVEAVHAVLPPLHDPLMDLAPPGGLKLTPRHYAYVKISEGCNHNCSFCIIPSLRGRLISRPAARIMYEAERLVAGGARELLVISQDTSAYGVDLKHAETKYRDRPVRAHMTDLARELGTLGAWVRLHYVYPYPHVDRVIAHMDADAARAGTGKILPYLDIPFQHASPRVLKAMKRPAHQEKTLDRIADWRRQVPDLTIRSSFVVGFPGETEDDFQELLDWLSEARLDRVGCFAYEDVAGAAANDLPGHVPVDLREERKARLLEHQRAISAERLARFEGRTIDVMIDQADADGAIGRSMADAPEIDGQVFIDGDGATALEPGQFARIAIDEASDYDLYGTLATYTKSC